MHASLEGRPAAPRRRMVAIGAVVFAALLVSSLGMGTGVAGAAPRALPATRVAAAQSAAKSKAEIKKDWIAFFSGKTKAPKRIKLLQNGQKFAAVIHEASANPLASTLSAKVSKVSLTSKTKARVTYSLVAAGQPVLSHQKGTSVLQGGTWKVGDASFCSLLVLEQGGKKAKLPKACGK
ncbi:MAG: hypothetical protein J2O47_04555 [Acidimicrobiaceae bacterium]|nr:hypothetical protein [Acidimicrobiaceae bacterium]